MNSNHRMFGIAFIVLLSATVLSCGYFMPERNIDYNAGRVAVDLPREIKYAENDRKIDQGTAVIISLPNDDRIYAGKERTATPTGELGIKINKLLQDKSDSDRMVYIAASSQKDYGAIVEIFDLIRFLDIVHVGLMVNKTGNNFPSRLAADLPVLSSHLLKPNPLILVVSISTDLKVRLNADDKGSANDSAVLGETLQQIFEQRREMHAYKPGYEMRPDLPDDERVEKTVVIKADRSVKYGDVVRIIDAIRGAGASPIILQIDDLSR